MSITFIVNAVSAERESNHNLGMQLIEACKQKIDWHKTQIETHQLEMSREEASLDAIHREIEARDRALAAIIGPPIPATSEAVQ